MMKFVVVFLGLLCLWKAAPVRGSAFGEEDVDCNARIKPNISYMQHKMIFDDEKTCCDGELFRLGKQSEYMKHFGDCNVEPKNTTMTIKDSKWTFFECMIKKALGSKELTQTSFTEFMAQNLSSSKRSAILSLVKNLKSKPVKSNGNIQLQSIKNYWDNYFDAEYQVCTKSATYKADYIKEGIKMAWEPADPCTSGKTPRTPFLPVTSPENFKCVKSLGEKYPAKLNTTSIFIQHTTCYLTLGGLLQEKDLNSASVNFDTIVTNTLPKYYSKSAKKLLLQSFMTKAKARYSNKLNGIQDVAQNIKKSAEKLYGNTVSADKKNAYLNMYTLYELFQILFDGVVENCRFFKK